MGNYIKLISWVNKMDLSPSLFLSDKTPLKYLVNESKAYLDIQLIN